VKRAAAPRRGDLVVVAMQGDYGKPRPALVVQSDLFNDAHASVTVVPVTTSIVDAPLFRLTVEPSRRNGLRSVSQVMIDKITTVRRDRLGQTMGRLEDDTLARASRALMLWFGLAG
jgi:mRNA interferase MazF